jgi:drug/metabolite transporter (DMT)-like permease
MLQRKQTLWMLLAAACAVLTLKFPFSSGLGVSAANKLITYVTAATNVPLLILTVLLVVVTLVNIFNYKNRKLQLRITIGLILVSLLNIFLFYQQTTALIGSTYALASILALAVPVALILAARGIFKDQKLVKNADRLR